MTDVLRVAQTVSELEVDERRPWYVEILPWEEKRNKLQNNYLQGWLYKNIVQQLDAGGIVIQLDDGREHPYTLDILHEIFKRTFLTYATFPCLDIETGELSECPLCYSTTTLLRRPKEGQEQRGFRNYVESIKQYVWQVWEIHIPPTYNEDFRSLERELQSGSYR